MCGCVVSTYKEGVDWKCLVHKSVLIDEVFCFFEMKGGRSMMSMEEGSKRRPFFSSPDELFDEEYYEEQLPEKKRRLTSEQVGRLPG